MPGEFVDTVQSFVFWCGKEVIDTHGGEEVPPHSVCFHGKTVKEVATEEVIQAIAEKMEKIHSMGRCHGIIPMKHIKVLLENYLLDLEMASELAVTT